MPEGRWVIDRSAMQQMFETAIGYPHELAAREARAIGLELILDSDHTFRQRMERAGHPAENAAGTWRVEGESVFLATTHENGRKLDQISEQPWQMTGEQLRYVPSDAYQLILHRVPD